MVAACFVLGMAALVAAGCGGKGSDSKVPVIHFTMGRDPTGFIPSVLKKCNEQNKDRYHIEPIYQPPTVDGQREQFIRRLAGKDPAMDIIGIDVIWTAEFSDAGWIYDMTEQVEPHKDEFVPAALNTVYYKGKYWAWPVGTNVALLYYRTDIIKTPPKTWEEMKEQAAAAMKTHPGMAGFLFQANQYEGLTVDALEFIFAANGKVLSDDGKESLIAKGDGTLHALTFMRSLFKDGVTPMQVTTFQEEESRQMFQQGKAIFLRNWPYVWALANGPDSKIKGKFNVVPLPQFEGRSRAGVLGGVNYAIGRYSRHPDLAFDAIQCIASPENMKQKMLVKGDIPALEGPYHDPEVKQKIPFIAVVRKSLDSAYNRPVTPYYNDVTYAINRNANNVAAGRISPDDAVKRMDHAIQLAIEGRGEI